MLQNDKVRPIIGRVGGKVRLSNWITDHLLRFDWSLYCEPFCGSSAVFFKLMQLGVFADIKKRGLQPKMILNDADQHIIHLFKVCRDYPELLAHQVAFTAYSRYEHKQSQSDTFDEDLDDLHQQIEMARKILINSWQSFKKQPFDSWGVESTQGSKSSVSDFNSLPDRLILASKALKQCYIENDDFESVVKRWSVPHGCYYFDPPYMNAEK
jgi:site-specific DNA-adenine methylase